MASIKGDTNVNLHLGTLIIIGLIVTMCSGKGDVEIVKKDTTELKKQLGVMDKKLDALVSRVGGETPANVEVPAAPADAGTAPVDAGTALARK